MSRSPRTEPPFSASLGAFRISAHRASESDARSPTETTPSDASRAADLDPTPRSAETGASPRFLTSPPSLVSSDDADDHKDASPAAFLSSGSSSFLPASPSASASDDAREDAKEAAVSAGADDVRGFRAFFARRSPPPAKRASLAAGTETRTRRRRMTPAAPAARSGALPPGARRRTLAARFGARFGAGRRTAVFVSFASSSPRRRRGVLAPPYGLLVSPPLASFFSSRALAARAPGSSVMPYGATSASPRTTPNTLFVSLFALILFASTRFRILSASDLRGSYPPSSYPARASGLSFEKTRGTYSESRKALASSSKVLSSTITEPARLMRTLLPGSATTRRTYPDMPSSSPE